MNLYETLSGLTIAAEKLRSDIGITDRIMHEINSKIMASPSQHETKRVWTEAYQDWVPLALSHPIVRDPMARLSKEDVQAAAIKVRKMRERALALYARWKSEMQVAFSSTFDSAGSGTSNGEGLGGRFLRGAVIGAGILGGIAALKALVSSSAPAPAQIPESGLPVKIVLPSTPSMTSGRTLEFIIPPEVIAGRED